MFRQIILLVCLIALTTAQTVPQYNQGLRQDGDKFIEIIFQQTELTEELATHSIDVRVSTENTTLTHVQFNVLEGFHRAYSYGLGQVKLTNYNTTQLTITTYVYGFPLEEQNTTTTEVPSY